MKKDYLNLLTLSIKKVNKNNIIKGLLIVKADITKLLMLKKVVIISMEISHYLIKLYMAFQLIMNLIKIILMRPLIN
jgi:hypothetical protein